MLENLYTTKMSTDTKKLQNRFSKIRSKNGRVAKLTALIIFAAVLLVMACATILIAARVNRDNNAEDSAYAMTQEAFSEYLDRPIGAVMADIDYADENKLVFHYGAGFFVINPENGEIRFMLSLPKFNVSQNQQGSNILDVKIDKDGKYAYLSSVGPYDEIKDFEEYIINLDTGEVQKGTMPANTALFTGIAPTVGTVPDPVGWFSNRCVIGETKTYYLTSHKGMVNDIQIIAVNNSDNEMDVRYLFNVEEAQAIKLYTPADIKDITNVELVVGGIKYPLAVTNAHTEIEKAFSSATKIKMGGTGCPTDAELIFTRKDGEKGKVYIATDSCAVFSSDVYYDYGEDNSMLLGYFGLDVNTVIDLTTINKSYMDNAETAVRNFLAAFEKSDLTTMKTLVTNEFIAQGYIDDAYGICYGMTRATLEGYSKANVDEFLNEYLARSENAQLTLSENDIELLKANSDELAVYTVIVTAESNIKGETKPPFKSFLNVICKKQNNGSWLVHKLD